MIPNEHIILCGGIQSTGTINRKVDVLALNLWEQKGGCNVTLRIEDIHTRLLRDVPPVFQDLLEIATYVYCADQAVTRGGIDVDTLGGYWRRVFRFHVPVRCPEFWRGAQIQNLLCRTLEFLSDDNFEFIFYPATGAPGFQQYLIMTDSDAPQGQPEQVMMYSGGLDSLSGAVQEAIVEKRRIVLVNHRPTPKLNGRLRALQNLLAEKAGALRPIHLSVRINKASDMNREYTQRTRSFLYLSLGTTVAKMLDLHSLRFYENGVVSLNLPVCAQVVGGRATRTTHPRTLRGFQELISLIADQPFTVENPFVWETKGEIIQRLLKAECGSLIAASTSCAHTWENTTENPHCGSCSQCIDRRMAVIAAKADEFDLTGNYRDDVFTESLPEDEDKTMVATYLERANRIRAMKDSAQFIEDFPEVARVLRFLGPNPASVAERVFALHQRHAAEVASAVKIMLARNTDKILARTLPGDCLLRIVYESNSVVSVATTPSVSRDTAKKVATLDAIADTTAKTLKHVEAMRPHVEGIPPLVKNAAEALANPLAAADDARRRMPLTREEHEIRDAIILHGGTGKGAAAALGVSEATLSRKRQIIRKKMKKAGFPDDIIFRPAAGHKVHVKKSDKTGEKPIVTYQAPSDDWRDDPDTRKRIIHDYVAASQEDKVAMRQYYPDIESEAAELANE